MSAGAVQPGDHPPRAGRPNQSDMQYVLDRRLDGTSNARPAGQVRAEWHQSDHGSYRCRRISARWLSAVGV